MTGLSFLLCLGCALYAVPWNKTRRKQEVTKDFNIFWKTRLTLQVASAVWLVSKASYKISRLRGCKHFYNVAREMQAQICIKKIQPLWPSILPSFPNSNEKGDQSVEYLLAGTKVVFFFADQSCLQASQNLCYLLCSWFNGSGLKHYGSQAAKCFPRE